MLTATEPAPPSVESQFGKLNFEEDWDQPSVKTEQYAEEPILKENPKRFVLFPIQYHEVWQAYKNAEAKFWSAEEIELSEDAEGWERLPGKDRAFITHAVALFAANDMLIGADVISPFSDEIQIPEARCFFGFQIMQRNIHAELFTVLLEMFCKVEEEREYVFKTCSELPSTSKKAAWVARHITDSPAHYSLRIIALALYVSLNHASTYASIFHIVKPSSSSSRTTTTQQGPRTAWTGGGREDEGLLPGLIRALSKQHRDHQCYFDFCGILSKLLVNKPSHAAVQLMASELVAVESSTVDDLFGICGGNVSLNGNAVDVKEVKAHVAKVADRVLEAFGVEGISVGGGEDSLGWVEEIMDSETRKDDFEHGGGLFGGNGGKAVAPAAQAMVSQDFTLDADF
ncbi:Ribonucleoside-diphosphate reductase subunit M2 [Rhizophlyctis rosea]|nr:Ribonucleoside-diphosphate reductase subunit M2 [Rhizophlyctis rosea]